MTADEIALKPAMSFALLKVFPLVSIALTFLLLAWCLSPSFILFSLVTLLVAAYRLVYIRSSCFLITAGYIRVTHGILSKRTEQVAMLQVKDYLVQQSLLLQLVKLMSLELGTTDRQNPVLKFSGIPESNLVDIITERVQAARYNNQAVELN